MLILVVAHIVHFRIIRDRMYLQPQELNNTFCTRRVICGSRIALYIGTFNRRDVFGRVFALIASLTHIGIGKVESENPVEWIRISLRRAFLSIHRLNCESALTNM